jgi:hypothetical protein
VLRTVAKCRLLAVEHSKGNRAALIKALATETERILRMLSAKLDDV